jgi:hypothetical protein
LENLFQNASQYNEREWDAIITLYYGHLYDVLDEHLYDDPHIRHSMDGETEEQWSHFKSQNQTNFKLWTSDWLRKYFEAGNDGQLLQHEYVDCELSQSVISQNRWIMSSNEINEHIEDVADLLSAVEYEFDVSRKCLQWYGRGVHSGMRHWWYELDATYEHLLNYGFRVYDGSWAFEFYLNRDISWRRHIIQAEFLDECREEWEGFSGSPEEAVLPVLANADPGIGDGEVSLIEECENWYWKQYEGDALADRASYLENLFPSTSQWDEGEWAQYDEGEWATIITLHNKHLHCLEALAMDTALLRENFNTKIGDWLTEYFEASNELEYHKAAELLQEEFDEAALACDSWVLESDWVWINELIIEVINEQNGG